jgi:hypothetical protein
MPEKGGAVVSVLKRRKYLTGVTGLFAGFMASRRVASSQQVQGMSANWTSRLFEAANSQATVVQTIAINDRAVTLFRDGREFQFGVGAYSLDGGGLWQYPLPPAFSYGAVGSAAGGKTVLLNALNLRQPGKNMIASCLLALDPESGKTSVVRDLTDSINSQLFFAGDGRLAAIGEGALQLWTFGADLSLTWKVPYACHTPPRLNLEVIDQGSLALVPWSATRIRVVSFSSGAMTEHAITSPEIEQARTNAQALRVRRSVADEVQLPIIPVTGTDGEGAV